MEEEILQEIHENETVEEKEKKDKKDRDNETAIAQQNHCNKKFNGLLNYLTS